MKPVVAKCRKVVIWRCVRAEISICFSYHAERNHFVSIQPN